MNNRYSVKDVVCDYGIYAEGKLISSELIFNDRRNAKEICRIMNLDNQDKIFDDKVKDMEKTIKFLCQNIRELKMSLNEYAPKESSYSLQYNEIQKKLDVINSIEVNETDYDGYGMIYAMVDNTEENIEKLHSIGFTDDDIAESCGVNNFDEIDKNEDLDICMLAFKYADLYWKGEFIQSEDIQLKK